MMVITIAVIVMTLFVFYWKFADGVIFNKPIVWTSDRMNIVTDKEIYEKGEMVKGHIGFCKLKNITGHLQWTLVDHYLIIYQGRDTVIGEGCREVDFDIQEIPKNTQSGSMHFEGFLSYKVNPFSSVVIELRTKTFKVK